MGRLTMALALAPLTPPALPAEVVHWPPLPTLTRLALALGVGLFVGLEREWRGHEAGLRTFGFAALLGGSGACWASPTPCSAWACSACSSAS